MFKLPSEWTTTKRHLIRVFKTILNEYIFQLNTFFVFFKFETVLKPGNEKYFHHWLLYECEKRYETQVILYGQPKPGACFPQYGNCFRLENFHP